MVSRVLQQKAQLSRWRNRASGQRIEIAAEALLRELDYACLHAQQRIDNSLGYRMPALVDQVVSGIEIVRLERADCGVELVFRKVQRLRDELVVLPVCIHLIEVLILLPVVIQTGEIHAVAQRAAIDLTIRSVVVCIDDLLGNDVFEFKALAVGNRLRQVGQIGMDGDQRGNVL